MIQKPIIQSKTTLVFTANKHNWTLLSDVIDDQDIPKRRRLTLRLICEEIYTNIMKYAYDSDGKVRITLTQGTDLTVRFNDWGKPYNPLKCQPPDITQDAKNRKIGGLGLYLVKKQVHSITYARRNKQNILTLVL